MIHRARGEKGIAFSGFTPCTLSDTFRGLKRASLYTPERIGHTALGHTCMMGERYDPDLAERRWLTGSCKRQSG